MAGALTISTLNNDTGVLATQNGMTGIAKAWINFDGTVSTPTIRSSFNVGSVTKNTTGDYTINFTTSMPNANYSALSTTGNLTGSFNASELTASSVRIYSYSRLDAYQQQDAAVFSVAIFSS